MDSYYCQQAREGCEGGDLHQAQYYAEQAGDGISAYGGLRYQNLKGKGFLGRFFKGTIMPLLGKASSYLFGKAKEGVVPFLQDIKEGDDWKTVLKKGGRRAAKSVLMDVANKVGEQDGSGFRRRKRRKGLRPKILKRVKSKHVKEIKKKMHKRRKTRRSSRKRSRGTSNLLFDC